MSAFRILLMLAIWLLYTIIAYNGCLRECCGDWKGDTTEVVVPPPVTDNGPEYPIYSNADDPAALKSELYAKYRTSILNGAGQDSILQITGYYYEGEPTPDGYENMGFARADRIKQLFLDRIPADRIVTRASLLDGDAPEGEFASGVLKWLAPEKTEDDDIIEIDNRIEVRFPFNSTNAEFTPAILAYLDKLAERVKASGESIHLTGHTDNIGGDAYNVRLGRNRARAIRKELVERGIDAALITIDSKGESQPTDTNATEAGRHNNRRVEIRLNKAS